MGVYQTIDKIIENHKVALAGAAAGLTLFISAANYQPTYAAGLGGVDTKTQQQTPVGMNSQSTGVNANGSGGVRRGALMIYEDGSSAFIPGLQINNNNRNDDTTTYTKQDKIQELNEAIKQNPNNGDNYIALSNAYIQEYGDNGIDLVIKTYEQVLPRAQNMTKQDNAKIRYALAIRYHNKNEINKSREMFKEVLKYDKANKDAKMWLDSLKK